jgi:hypothetical protein
MFLGVKGFGCGTRFRGAWENCGWTAGATFLGVKVFWGATGRCMGIAV